VKVRANRQLELARVSCPDGTCTIRKIQVRYVLRHQVFNGTASVSSTTIPEGGSVIIRTRMPISHYLRLTQRKSGTVTAIVSVDSTNRSRVFDFVRTGLRR
jgi:hypothetical protein